MSTSFVNTPFSPQRASFIHLGLYLGDRKNEDGVVKMAFWLEIIVERKTPMKPPTQALRTYHRLGGTIALTLSRAHSVAQGPNTSVWLAGTGAICLVGLAGSDFHNNAYIYDLSPSFARGSSTSKFISTPYSCFRSGQDP